MAIPPAQIETVLAMLAATPQRLASLSAGVELARLHTKAGEEDWSINDILAHLRACTDVWSKSMHAMLAQDHPTLRYVSPRTWIKKTNYSQQPFDQSLKVFIEQRTALLALLTSLSTESWARGATFTGSTQGRNHNVYTYAHRMAQHENEHCQQIEELLKRLS